MAVDVKRVKVYNRFDSPDLVSHRLSNSTVSLLDKDGLTLKLYTIGNAKNISEFDINFDSCPIPTTSKPTVSPITTIPTPALTSSCVSGMNVEVRIITDYYPEEITWTLRNSCNTVVEMSGGPYKNKTALYTAQKCLPPGNYTFTINDSADDGINTFGYKNGTFRR